MKTCKYCGCDISHLRANATICGSRECTNAYRRELKSKPKEPRTCEICGTSIDDLPGQRRICKNPECEAEQKRRKYAQTLKEKICKKCGDTFLGTSKQTCCENCRKHKDITFEVIEQKVVCEDCGALLRTESKKVNGKTKEIIAKGMCDACKQKHREKLSLQMKEHNPMFDPEVVKKTFETRRYKYLQKCEEEGRLPYVRKGCKGETKEERVQRMKEHNPMFDPETKAKVSKTLKEKILSGEIVYAKGPEHHLWKGNRNFNKAVRIELRKWVKEQMEKVHYICQKCGKTHTELHVHHLHPLRDIISDTLNKNNLTIIDINSMEGSEQYFDIIKQIVEYHYQHNDIGIVVCPQCHNELDSYYKRKTHENSKYKES